MTRRAFTYIELLVALVIIGILAAIGVPNFLGAQIRAKVARSRADMAVIAAALEDYRLDHRAYPANLPAMDAILASPEARLGPAPYAAGFAQADWQRAAGDPFTALTTPMQYLSEIPSDPFNLWRGAPYLYANWTSLPGGGARLSPDEPFIPFALVSLGPDSTLNLLFPAPIGYLPFDPTNGITSNGDLFEYPR